jgi:hypothetical protein
MNYFLLALFLSPVLIQPAFAQQVIEINSTTPCFLNMTAGIQMWKNCGADEDFLSFALLPFEWVTGGYFSMILVSILILAVYIKYQKPLYSMVIGIIFLPMVFALFLPSFLGFSIILAFLGIAGAVYVIFKHRTQ